MRPQDRMLAAFAFMVIMFAWVVSEAWENSRVPVLNLALGCAAAIYIVVTNRRIKRAARARDSTPPKVD